MLARVRLFAVARELAGRPVVDVELPDVATVAELKAALGVEVVGLARLMSTLRFAVNAEYADDTTPIPAGADLAAIPPVSGGQD